MKVLFLVVFYRCFFSIHLIDFFIINYINYSFYYFFLLLIIDFIVLIIYWSLIILI